MSELALRVALVAGLSLLARSAWSGHVVVLRPAVQRDQAADADNHALIAELALAGFTVSVERTQPEPNPTLSLSQVAARPGVIAAVSVERHDEVSVGQLWLHGADAAIVVEEQASQAVVAHSVVVLELTELLLEHQTALASDAEPRPQPRSPITAASPTRSTASLRDVEPSPQGADADLAVRPWVGAGLDVLASKGVHAWRLGLSAELRVTPRVGIFAGAHLPLTAHDVNSSLGNATVTATDVALGVMVDVFEQSRFALGVGPRVGLRLLQANAEPTADYEGRHASAVVLAPGADVRAAYGLGVAHVAMVLGGSWLTPQPQLASGSGDVSSLGSGNWTAAFLLGWELEL